jgi:ribosomal protein L12E/L44/L45/RPP1/RPP2
MTGLNMEGLSLTPPDPISSEYASMNGLLKMLHLNRSLGDSREERSKSVLKELEGRKLQPLRPLATATPQKVPPASKQPDDRQVNNKKIDEQKEKDSVTSIYEEANRYVFLLLWTTGCPYSPSIPAH